jgi:hypothetical protein
MGMAPPRRNFNDFLINFGLDIASRPSAGPGLGGLLTTAAQSAQGPYEKFAKTRAAEQNLLRQVGMEAEIMDINKENAAAAAAAKEAGAMSRLEKQIQADKDLYELEKSENLDALIQADTAVLSDIDGGIYNTVLPAKNHATWKHKKSKDYDQSKIGGVLTKKQVTDANTQSKFATSQGKKNGVGMIYYDPFSDQVLEIYKIPGENKYGLRPVDGSVTESITTEVTDNNQTEIDKEKIRERFRYFTPETGAKIDKYMEGVQEEEGDFGTGA